MADYYPLIVRAIAGLGANTPGESRRALYERARAALISQLRSVEPALSESEITGERLALEEAIRSVEDEVGRKQGVERQQIEEQNEHDPLAELARLIGRTDPFAINSSHQENPSAVHPLHRYGSMQDSDGSDTSDDPEGNLPVGPPAWMRRAGARMANSNREIDRPPTPPIDIIPEQDLTTAIAFSSTRKGPLDLIRDPPSDPHDREQSELYLRIRRQLRKLKEEIPSQERSQVNDAIDDFLDNHPDEWSKVEYKKLVWLSGNSLRTLLAQHDSIKNDPEHYSKLPPSVAEALRNPVQAWSIFVQGDPQLALLDYYSLGPREQQQVRENLAAVAEIVSRASEDRRITTEKAASAIDSTMKSASGESTDINTKLAQGLADKTSRNLFSQILRRAYLWMDEVKDPESKASRELAASVAKGAAGAAGSLGLLTASHYAFPFLEFVATNLPAVKQYVVVAFQHSQMTEIVDAIEFEYYRLKRLFKGTGDQ
jgi:hypothetical protein